MSKRNEFQDLMGAAFSLIMLAIMGFIVVGSLGDPIGISGVFVTIFIIGIIAIGLGLIIQIKSLFKDLF